MSAHSTKPFQAGVELKETWMIALNGPQCPPAHCTGQRDRLPDGAEASEKPQNMKSFHSIVKNGIAFDLLRMIFFVSSVVLPLDVLVFSHPGTLR